VFKTLLVGIFIGALTPIFPQQASSSAASPETAATAARVTPRRLAPENAYTRVYCIVPIVGSGSLNDPKRPMFAPLPPVATAAIDRTGIIAYQFQVSDDGKTALAEFVTVSRDGLAPILSSTNPNVISFERGKHTRQEIETAFQKYKKNFSFDSFRPVRAQ
jgi:hypothetical protein